MIEAYEEAMRRGGAAALREVDRFFRGEDAVHRALQTITSQLKQLEISYAVCGGMALVAHGYNCTTVDVDLIVGPGALARIHAELGRRGLLGRCAGSKALRDAMTGVRIDFFIAGQFPGDGRPKPVSFPDPLTAAVEIDGIRYVTLEKLIELKLSSGMTNVGRIKDLADVQELIRVLHLKADFSERLDAYVRAKYSEMWTGVKSTKDSDPSR